MALQLDWQSPYSGLVSGAYAVIDQLNHNKHDKVAHVVVSFYETRALRLAGKLPFTQIGIDVTGADFDANFADLTAVTPIKSAYADAYAYVKTLPQFAVAVDAQES